MKKVFIYDLIGCDLYACNYVGMAYDGKPLLTIMTPGYSVENLFEYLEKNDEEMGDCILLCEEGKPADSELIVKMFGHMFLNVHPPFEKMSARLREIRMYGIDYERELQKLTVTIFEMDDVKLNKKKYRLFMLVGEHRNHIYEVDLPDKIGDIFSQLRGFFYYMENEVHIPLKKHLEMRGSLDKQLKHKASDIFDEIDVVCYEK